jgi:Fe-Mn family superoxide dismutase|tara:strand:+ start:423 stop:980 length:558 start_codon:yes stop_codon:yes gene_type:complete
MHNFIKYITLIENAQKHPGRDLTFTPLPYKRDALEPSISEKTIDYHYATLYRAYVDKFNKGEGDAEFNEAGAFLHDIYFTQFQEPKDSNQPTGKSLALIEEHFGTFSKFKEEFQSIAMKIQGSGWAYLSRRGEIKTIKNHAIRKDIALLVDWWEHAWALDYQADKKAYLRNTWKIINWDVINQRI